MKKEKNSLEILLSGALISLVFGALGYTLAFAFRVIAARFYGPEKFGLLEMTNTIFSVAAVASLLGIHAGVSRYISVYEERGEFEKLKGYLKFIFKIPIILSIIVSVLLFILAPKINSFFNFPQEFIIFLRIISFAVPLQAVNKIIHEIFFAKKKVLVQNISYNIVERAALLIGIIAVIFLKLNFVYVIAVIFLSQLAAFLFNLGYLKFGIHFKKEENSNYPYKSWLAFSLPLFFVNMSAFLINWTDNIVIGKYLTSRELGIYATCFSLASFLLFFQISFAGVFMPLVSRAYARNDKKELELSYQKAQNWAFGLALPFALFFIFFAGDLLVGVYGREFSSGAILLVILTVGLLFNVYTGMNASLLKVVKKTAFLFKTKIIIAVFNVIFCILLVKIVGVVGAAVSTAAAIIMEQAIYFVKSKKYIGIRHDTLVNLKFFLTALALVALARYAVSAAKIDLSVYAIVILFIFYFLLYAAVCIFAKILREDDRKFLKELLFSYEK